MHNDLGKILSCRRRLYTRNLLLRRLNKKDDASLAELVLKAKDFLLPWLPPFPEKIDRGIAAEWIADEHRSLQKAERVDLGIFLGENKLLLGRVSLHSLQWGIPRSAAISYWLSEESCGNGFATEAAASMISFAFEEMRLHRIYADVVPENKPSIAICQKLGFRHEGLSKKVLFLNGHWQDSIRFALLEEEYDRLAESWIKKRFLGV